MVVNIIEAWQLGIFRFVYQSDLYTNSPSNKAYYMPGPHKKLTVSGIPRI